MSVLGNRWRCRIIAAVLSIIPATVSAEWRIDDMNRQIDQTNFLVNRGCSGTLVDLKNRYILTAQHCVQDQYEVVEREKISDDGVITKEKVRRLKDGTVTQFVFNGGDQIKTTVYKVRLMAVDADRDLAMLQIIAPIPNTMAARLACADPRRGQTAYVVGNPAGDLYASVTAGLVSSIQRTYGLIAYGGGSREKQPLMQVSAGIVGGNSGGAVYDASGDLIGVPVLANRVNEVVAFAVPLQAIRAFLDNNKMADLYGHCR